MYSSTNNSTSSLSESFIKDHEHLANLINVNETPSNSDKVITDNKQFNGIKSKSRSSSSSSSNQINHSRNSKEKIITSIANKAKREVNNNSSSAALSNSTSSGSSSSSIRNNRNSNDTDHIIIDINNDDNNINITNSNNLSEVNNTSKDFNPSYSSVIERNGEELTAKDPLINELLQFLEVEDITNIPAGSEVTLTFDPETKAVHEEFNKLYECDNGSNLSKISLRQLMHEGKDKINSNADKLLSSLTPTISSDNADLKKALQNAIKENPEIKSILALTSLYPFETKKEPALAAYALSLGFTIAVGALWELWVMPHLEEKFSQDTASGVIKLVASACLESLISETFDTGLIQALVEAMNEGKTSISNILKKIPEKGDDAILGGLFSAITAIPGNLLRYRNTGTAWDQLLGVGGSMFATLGAVTGIPMQLKESKEQIKEALEEKSKPSGTTGDTEDSLIKLKAKDDNPEARKQEIDQKANWEITDAPGNNSALKTMPLALITNSIPSLFKGVIPDFLLQIITLAIVNPSEAMWMNILSFTDEKVPTTIQQKCAKLAASMLKNFRESKKDKNKGNANEGNKNVGYLSEEEFNKIFHPSFQNKLMQIGAAINNGESPSVHFVKDWLYTPIAEIVKTGVRATTYLNR